MGDTTKDKEILTKAIEKARANGWKQLYAVNIETSEPVAYSFIFRHDFAKALWGEEQAYYGNDNNNGSWLYCPNFKSGDKDLPNNCEHGNTHFRLSGAWQYHLQQMVIADDPIKYLGDNL